MEVANRSTHENPRRCANGNWFRSLRDPTGHERYLGLNKLLKCSNIGFMLVEEDARTHACLSAATADGSSGFRQYETEHRRSSNDDSYQDGARGFSCCLPPPIRNRFEAPSAIQSAFSPYSWSPSPSHMPWMSSLCQKELGPCKPRRNLTSCSSMSL